MKMPKIIKTKKSQPYPAGDVGNGYPDLPNGKNKPTKQRGAGAAKKGYTSNGPMG